MNYIERVENQYSVIKKALQIGLVSEDNYQPEFVKEATLAYLDDFTVLLTTLIIIKNKKLF